MNKTIYGVCIASAVPLSSCGPDPQSLRIISRVASLDGTRDAVYAENMSGDATVGPSEDVYVVPKGTFPQIEDRAFAEERVCNLKVRWLSNKALEVDYSAREPLTDRSIIPRRVKIYARWQGSDPADGC